MPKDNIHRLQDTFLEHLMRRRTPVTVFLANGVRLQGVVAGFDAFCVLLERDGEQQIVYKHSITTTVPVYPVDLRDDGDFAGAAASGREDRQAGPDRRAQGHPPPAAMMEIRPA